MKTLEFGDFLELERSSDTIENFVENEKSYSH